MHALKSQCVKKAKRIKFFSGCVDIESMKNLALIMMLSVTGVVLSAEEYTIQTISAQKEASITPAFEKKVQKSALVSAKKKEGSCNIVTVGEYPTTKAASRDLTKAKKISKDAFIRPVARTTPKACEVHSAVAEIKVSTTNEPKVATNEHKEVKATEVKAIEVQSQVAPIKDGESTTAKHDAAVSNAIAQIASTQAASAALLSQEKSEPSKTKLTENVTYVCDRNLAHKSDIQEAIEYYKRSPYYTFRPVALQR